MNSFSKITATSVASAALAITFSCSSGSGGGGEPPDDGISSGINISSSSDDGGGSGNSISNYRTVTIGSQEWMAENLNYNVEGSKCYNDEPANCVTYGRLYDWATAKTACPAGWHLPSGMEWQSLMNFVDGTSLTSPATSNTAAKKLKATSGWRSNGNGTDDYGFAALPGGFGSSDGSFRSVGYNGYWWSASEGSANDAYSRSMGYGYDSAGWDNDNKILLLSVRCVRD